MSTKPRKQKRYEDEPEILRDIDKTRDAIRLLNLEASILDRFADTLRDFPGWFGSDKVLSISGYREQAEKSRRRAANYQNKKLPKLGQALAQIRTGVFPEVVGDESVVL